MFEVGKLSDESLDSFIEGLDAIDEDIEEAEGEARTYVDHAVAVREALHFLRNNEKCKVEDEPRAMDLLRCERLHSLEENTRLRILNKNYVVLISMAPISTETQAITQVVPRHFGPSLPEISSVWFQLFLYHTVGSGLPCILYPKGTRASHLPSCFREYDKVLFTTWDHDPVVVQTHLLLATLNETLKTTPVFVQGYSYIPGALPYLVKVPFPLESKCQNLEQNNDVKENNNVEEKANEGEEGEKKINQEKEREERMGSDFARS